ncbi:unnamed protein product, partial [marine sediment metagenome]
PTVVEALVAVDPPPYAVHAVPVLSDLAGGEVSAIVGSTLHVSVRSSKPLGVELDGAAAASLEFTDGTRIPLRFTAADRQLLEADFELTADARFRVHLVDADDFENRGGRAYRIEALPDQPPNVVLLEPRSVTEITPDGSVLLLVRADDDFGITAMSIVGRNLDSDAPFEVPLTDQMAVTPAGDRVLALAEHVWDIAPLGLGPGAVLVYQAQAADNFPGGAIVPDSAAADEPGPTGPQVGRSAQLRLKIISPADFENRLRDELTLLQARIRRAMLDQQALNDETQALAAASDPDAPPTDADLQAAAAQSSRQVRLANRVQDLSRRFDRLRKKMTYNNVRDAQRRDQVHRMAKTLLEAAAGPMSSAGRRLGDAGQQDVADRRSLLDQADADQQAAIDA